MHLSGWGPGWHHSDVINFLINEIRTEVEGEISDRSRLVDHLLDVRLAAADRPEMVITVDRLLVDMPGRTTVTNSWWTEALDELAAVASWVPTG